ncbi:glutathione S-transferase family protein [Pelagibacterium limicola]|uniref:glutathione S-transferase family protein n=1 Tax=Pelagibacterium limicola TaxID=2791022 RepID=UPI0031B641D9
MANYLGSDIEFEFAAPLAPGNAEKFRHLNPNLRLPILLVPEGSVWETDAIACRLSQSLGHRFWRSGSEEPEMIQWLSWGKENFVRACDMVHFERGTKQRYGIGPVHDAAVSAGLSLFEESAVILDAALEHRTWLLGDEVSYADFRMATFLPFNDAADLPLHRHASVERWYRQLEAIPAWNDPFEGLIAPALPPHDPGEG